jgi:threonine synthase
MDWSRPGFLAQQMGLPVPFWIAATNANDTVPRYLRSQHWEPHETVSTISNAMDVSQPNNWPRIEELFRKARIPRPVLSGISISEEQTQQTMRELSDLGYVADPHSAVAYAGLRRELLPWSPEQKTGVFLCTAHPAKFKPTVDTILNCDIPLPQALSDVAQKSILSHPIPNDLQALKTFLWRLVSS